jgi:hypothetical protein
VSATRRITMIYQRLAKVFLICSEELTALRTAPFANAGIERGRLAAAPCRLK